MEQLSRSEMVQQMKRQNKFKNKSIKIQNSNKKNVTDLIISKDVNLMETQENKSFQFRIVFTSFLFLLFLGMKEKELHFQNITYHTVLDVISDNGGMEAAEEFVITTFNSLD